MTMLIPGLSESSDEPHGQGVGVEAADGPELNGGAVQVEDCVDEMIAGCLHAPLK